MKNNTKTNNKLNKLSRLKRLEYIYDKSCQKIDNLHKDENVCDFKCNKCLIQQMDKSNEINGCCRTCIYQSTSGCKTSNLTCKLFWCDEVKKRYKFYEMKDLPLLNNLSKRQRFILKLDYFQSREEVLLDLWFGSIILASLRLVFSCYKRSYYLLFKDRKQNKVGKFVILITLLFTFASIFTIPYFLITVWAVGIIDSIILLIFRKNKNKITKRAS